jgi:hypothetical protein
VRPDNARAVAMLTVLRDQLAPLVDDFAFDQVSVDDRRAVARALRQVADVIEPAVVVPGAFLRAD